MRLCVVERDTLTRDSGVNEKKKEDKLSFRSNTASAHTGTVILSSSYSPFCVSLYYVFLRALIFYFQRGDSVMI